jgi:hypothetical protein
MKSIRGTRRGRALASLAGTALALGMLTACSSTPAPAPAASSVAASSVAPMPKAATFLADMPEPDGTTMTMAVTVEDGKAVAYATNGTDVDAYFFGTEANGKIDLMSMYADNITASFDGTKLSGEMTMNEKGAAPVNFTAASVSAPAGIYTATHNNARASFIVRPDQSMVGLMDNRAPGDHRVSDAAAARDQQFKDSVRQMRLDRQMQPAPVMAYGTWSVDMHGESVTAVRVTGDMTM